MECALRYELDDYGKVGITLENFKSLKEMDLFMRRFHDSNEVKKIYFNIINIFLKTKQAKEFLDNYKEKVNKENNGFIKGYIFYKNKFHNINLIYQNVLVSDIEAYKRLKEKLEERKILYDIYNKKYFILPSKPTYFLKDELQRIIRHYGTKKVFIIEFIRYLKKCTIGERYIILRVLCDKCDLLNIKKIRSYNLYKIRYDEIKNEYNLVKVNHYSAGDFTSEEVFGKDNCSTINTRKDANDEFHELLKDYDISYILENYDLDEIDKNTDYFDNLEKRGRRK